MDSMVLNADLTELSPEYVAWLRSGIDALEARRRRIEAQQAQAASLAQEQADG
jgi:hypothetical protein